MNDAQRYFDGVATAQMEIRMLPAYHYFGQDADGVFQHGSQRIESVARFTEGLFTNGWQTLQVLTGLEAEQVAEITVGEDGKRFWWSL